MSTAAITARRPGPAAWLALTICEAKMVVRDTAGLVVPIGLPLLILVMNASSASDEPVANGRSALDVHVLPLVFHDRAGDHRHREHAQLPRLLPPLRHPAPARRHPRVAGDGAGRAADREPGAGGDRHRHRVRGGAARVRGAAAGERLGRARRGGAGDRGDVRRRDDRRGRGADAELGGRDRLVGFFALGALGGLFGGTDGLPSGLARVGEALPFGASVEALSDAWAGTPVDPAHLIALAVATVVGVTVAAVAFRWD